MAIGTNWNTGGLAAPTDVEDAGIGAWSRMSAMNPMSPMVGGPGDHAVGPFNLPYSNQPDNARIVTQDSWAAAGPMSGPGVQHLDDWRDAINPQSPIFWLMLLTILGLGLIHLNVSAKVGKRGVRVSAG